jgi:RNA polymerase sigma-70 factor (ECF subfamily)
LDLVGGDSSISELVRRAQGGDRQAFETIFHRYERRLFNFVYQVIGNADDAADLTQDVFVRIYNGLGELRAEDAFNTWIYRIALNLCRDHLRRTRRIRTESIEQGGRSNDEDESAGIEIPDWSDNPEQVLQTDEMQEAVRRAVRALPEHYRNVVVLHHLQGMEVTDIARIVGCQVGTVKSRLSRGRDELKRRLEKYMTGDR